MTIPKFRPWHKRCSSLPLRPCLNGQGKTLMVVNVGPEAGDKTVKRCENPPTFH